MESFLIVGMGRFGSSLAVELSNLGHDVLAIDKNEDRISDIAELVTHAVIGDAKDESVMDSLGVGNFDVAVVSITNSIEDSVLITIMLKERGVKRVIAKAKDPLHAKVLSRVGADETVLPESDMGMRLAQRLSTKSVVDFTELSAEYSIVEIDVPKSWEGKTMSELDVRGRHRINVIAVRTEGADGVRVMPDVNYRFRDDEHLVVLGANGDIKRLRGE